LASTLNPKPEPAVNLAAVEPPFAPHEEANLQRARARKATIKALVDIPDEPEVEEAEEPAREENPLLA